MEVDFLKSIIVFLFVLSGSAVSGQLTYRELADVIRMDSDSLERQLDSLFRQTGESGSDSLLALAQCYRGILACRTGSCFVAADAFDVALAYSPHSDYAGLVWSELGFCFEGQGNYDRAILATEESLEWATSRNDTMAMVASRISLGRQKMRVGDQAGALTDLEMAAVMLNGRRGVWSEIGQINYHFSVVSQSVDRTHLVAIELCGASS